jgi:cytochrome P450
MSARRLPPGPGLTAPLGAVHFVLDPLGNVRSFARRYGPVARTRFPGFGVMIYVSEPELVKQVFTGDPAVLHAGEATATVLGPAVGPNSVLTLDEEPHMRQRKLLLPPFHGENVHRWAGTIREITERDMSMWPVGRAFSLRTHT